MAQGVSIDEPKTHGISTDELNAQGVFLFSRAEVRKTHSMYTRCRTRKFLSMVREPVYKHAEGRH